MMKHQDNLLIELEKLWLTLSGFHIYHIVKMMCNILENLKMILSVHNNI